MQAGSAALKDTKWQELNSGRPGTPLPGARAVPVGTPGPDTVTTQRQNPRASEAIGSVLAELRLVAIPTL